MTSPDFWLKREAEFLTLPEPTSPVDALRVTITNRADLLEWAATDRKNAEACVAYGPEHPPTGLAKKMRKEYPGVYDDMDDATLEARVRAERAREFTEAADRHELTARAGDLFTISGGASTVIDEYRGAAVLCATGLNLVPADATDDEAVNAWLGFLRRESPYCKPDDKRIGDLRAASAAMCRTLARRAEGAQFKKALLQKSEQPDDKTETKKTRRRDFVLPILNRIGISASGWATRAGVYPEVVTGYLDGKTKPRRTTRAKLAKALGVPETELPA